MFVLLHSLNRDHNFPINSRNNFHGQTVNVKYSYHNSRKTVQIFAENTECATQECKCRERRYLERNTESSIHESKCSEHESSSYTSPIVFSETFQFYTTIYTFFTEIY